MQVSFEVYRGSMNTGKLLYHCPERHMAVFFIQQIRAKYESDPNGWRGDITLARVIDGQRQHQRSYRRPRDVPQMILRLMGVHHGENRVIKSAQAVPVPKVQRSDDVRALRPDMGYKRSRSS